MKYESVLVTGGCGFIGVNFIRHLLDETDFGGRVINVDSLTYAGNPFSLSDLAERHPARYVFERADICDAPALDRIFGEWEIDAVVHFAAESHVDRSIAGSEAFMQTNIIGTHRLLEAARARGSRIRRFHHVSTDEVFGSLGAAGYFAENTPYRPNSPYAASKAAADHLVRAWCATYGLPVTLSNCSNNYGPYQFPEKLIPLMILNAMEGSPLPVYGDGLNVRDWLYVRDHAVAIRRILESGKSGETYAVGGRCEKTNRDVVERICDRVEQRIGPLPDGRARRTLIAFVQDRPGHDRRYAIDSTRIEQELGWRPEESFETGLDKTIRWYLDHDDWVGSVRTGEYRDWIRSHYG